MFRRKRILKKEKSKYKLRRAFLSVLLLIIALCAIEYVYLNFSFGKPPIISPIAQNKVSAVANFEKQLDKSGIKYESVAASSDASFVVTLQDQEEVIFSSKKDIGSQISSLQLMLSRLTIEGKRLKILDFRYDNPVVTF